jgi:hypothetical protein
MMPLDRLLLVLSYIQVAQIVTDTPKVVELVRVSQALAKVIKGTMVSFSPTGERFMKAAQPK